jgi:hypothetical protein
MKFQKRIPHEREKEKKERNKVGPRLEGKKGNSNSSSSRHVAITWSYTTTNEVSGRRGA